MRKIALPTGAVSFLLVLAALLFVPIETRNEVCRSCVARRDITEYAVRTRTVTTGSTLETEIFGGSHAHTWSFANSRSWRAISCGSPLGNPLAHLYENEPEFRDHVTKRLADGSLRREEFVAWLDLPQRPTPAAQRAPGFREKAEAALALATECGAAARSSYMFRDWTDRDRGPKHAR